MAHVVRPNWVLLNFTAIVLFRWTKLISIQSLEIWFNSIWHSHRGPFSRRTCHMAHRDINKIKWMVHSVFSRSTDRQNWNKFERYCSVRNPDGVHCIKTISFAINRGPNRNLIFYRPINFRWAYFRIGCLSILRFVILLHFVFFVWIDIYSVFFSSLRLDAGHFGLFLEKRTGAAYTFSYLTAFQSIDCWTLNSEHI